MAEAVPLPFVPLILEDTCCAPDAPDSEQWELLSVSTSSFSPASPRDTESLQHSSGNKALLAGRSGHESSVQTDGGGGGYLIMDWKEPLHWFCDGNGSDCDGDGGDSSVGDRMSGPLPHGFPGSESPPIQVSYGQEEEIELVSTPLMVAQIAIHGPEAIVADQHASPFQGNDEDAGNPRSQENDEGARNPRSQGNYESAGNPRTLICDYVNASAETERQDTHEEEGLTRGIASLDLSNHHHDPHHYPHTDIALNAASCEKSQKNASQPRSQTSRAIWKIAIASSLFGLLIVGHYCQGKRPQIQHLRPEPSATLHQAACRA